MWKWLFGLAGAAALAGGIWWVFPGRSTGEPQVLEELVRVQRAAMQVFVSATGEVRPVYQVELKSKASGQIIAFKTLEGEVVEPARPVCTLDKKYEERNRARARMARDEARERKRLLEQQQALDEKNSASARLAVDAELETRTLELRGKERLGREAVSETDLALARLAVVQAERTRQDVEARLDFLKKSFEPNLRLAEVAIERAEQDLSDAEDRYRDTEVAAPISGVLLKKYVEEGQIVSSGVSSVSGGTLIALVGILDELVVVTNVDETDIGKVVVGQPARITVDAFPGRSIPGKVLHIPPMGEVQSNIIVFKVKVSVKPERQEALLLLKAGMTANVDLEIASVENALLLPSEAVRYEKEKAYVLCRDGVGTRHVPITVGLDNGVQLEIKEGLQEGDEVLLQKALPAGGPGVPGAATDRTRMRVR